MAHLLVTGASGYIGGRLVPELLEAGHTVRCLARTPAKLDDQPWRSDVEVAEGDVTDGDSLADALAGIDAAYFLVHSMGGSDDFAAEDRKAAEVFRDACAAAGVRRIVYLGGLGRDDDPKLSHHLQSRHEVGRVLADGPVPATELRAAIIIGSGSASFEMLRYLVEVLPVMTTPRWVDNRCQPIAIRDVLAWLVGSVRPEDLDDPADHVHEVGGPDVLTYRELMQAYAEVAGLPRRRIVVIPVLSPSLSSRWIGLVTPLPTGLARPLVESLINEVVVTDPPPSTPFDREPLPFRRAVELALDRSAELRVSTRWSDAGRSDRSPADPQPTDPDWAGGSLLVEATSVPSTATPEELWATLSAVGGDVGWYGSEALWRARGRLDQLVGGVGERRGRDHPTELRAGDAVDSWRIDDVEPGRLVRLRSEMRLPGQAWLEWRVEPAEGGRGSVLHQTATFSPRGLFGRAYWYAAFPAHRVSFGRMAQHVAGAAEHRSGAPAAPAHAPG